VNSKLEQDLYNYLSPGLILAGYMPEQIIFGYENGVRLEGYYVVMTLSTMNQDLPVEVRNSFDTNIGTNPDKLIKEHLIYRYGLTVSFSFYGDENLLFANKFKALLASTEQIELAELYKFGFVGYTPTISLPDIIKNIYANRATFDITLNRTMVETVDISTIGQVTVIGIDADTGEEIVNETIKEVE
jgi:hypothetical protein